MTPTWQEALRGVHTGLRNSKEIRIMTDTNKTQAQQQPPRPDPEQELLGVFSGKWINQGPVAWSIATRRTNQR